MTPKKAKKAKASTYWVSDVWAYFDRDIAKQSEKYPAGVHEYVELTPAVRAALKEKGLL